MMQFGDIPEGSLRAEVMTHASAASDGGSAAFGIGTDAQRWRAPQAGVIVGVEWEPTGANQVASQEASYRKFTVYNGSTDGAGTAAIGTMSLSASLASNGTRAFTLNPATSSNTVAAGELVAISHALVGSNHSQGTVLKAGAFSIRWRPI